MKKLMVEVVVSKDADKLLKKNLEKPNSIDNKLTIYFDSIELYNKTFSPRRKELLVLVLKKPSLNVTQLASELKRPKEAISRDLLRLSLNGLIELKKQGRNVFVIPRAKEIRFRIEEKPITSYA